MILNCFRRSSEPLSPGIRCTATTLSNKGPIFTCASKPGKLPFFSCTSHFNIARAYRCTYNRCGSTKSSARSTYPISTIPGNTTASVHSCRVKRSGAQRSTSARITSSLSSTAKDDGACRDTFAPLMFHVRTFNVRRRETSSVPCPGTTEERAARPTHPSSLAPVAPHITRKTRRQASLDTSCRRTSREPQESAPARNSAKQALRAQTIRSTAPTPFPEKNAPMPGKALSPTRAAKSPSTATPTSSSSSHIGNSSCKHTWISGFPAAAPLTLRINPTNFSARSRAKGLRAKRSTTTTLKDFVSTRAGVPSSAEVTRTKSNFRSARESSVITGTTSSCAPPFSRASKSRHCCQACTARRKLDSSSFAAAKSPSLWDPTTTGSCNLSHNCRRTIKKNSRVAFVTRESISSCSSVTSTCHDPAFRYTPLFPKRVPALPRGFLSS